MEGYLRLMFNKVSKRILLCVVKLSSPWQHLPAPISSQPSTKPSLRQDRLQLGEAW